MEHTPQTTAGMDKHRPQAGITHKTGIEQERGAAMSVLRLLAKLSYPGHPGQIELN